MEFDYSALRGRIVEKFGTCDKFAKSAGISPENLSMKLRRRGFRATEIAHFSQLLDISSEEIGRYFFCPKS